MANPLGGYYLEVDDGLNAERRGVYQRAVGVSMGSSAQLGDGTAV
jgi:hypothetical protein